MIWEIKTPDRDLFAGTAKDALSLAKRLIKYHCFDDQEDELDMMNELVASFIKDENHFGSEITPYYIKVNRVFKT